MVYKTKLSLNQVKCIAECSAILSTLIKLPFVIKTFVLSIFEWLLNRGFTQVLLQVQGQESYIFTIFFDKIKSYVSSKIKMHFQGFSLNFTFQGSFYFQENPLYLNGF